MDTLKRLKIGYLHVSGNRAPAHAGYEQLKNIVGDRVVQVRTQSPR